MHELRKNDPLQTESMEKVICLTTVIFRSYSINYLAEPGEIEILDVPQSTRVPCNALHTENHNEVR